MIAILIVEDNKEIAKLLNDFLSKENYIVSITNNGENALALYEKYGARLVLLDIMLTRYRWIRSLLKNSRKGKYSNYNYECKNRKG